MQEVRDTLRQQKREEYQRRIIREIRTVLPDLASIPMITEVVCGTRSDVRHGTGSAVTMAELQEMWHNAPEGTDAARCAFKHWNARAVWELDRIPLNTPDDTDSAREKVQRQLKELFYNSPPGGSARRLIVGRIMRIMAWPW
jgi:hypothetical protein